MSTVTKTDEGYQVKRTLGKDGKGIPLIKLIKGFGLDPDAKFRDYTVTQSEDAKTIIIRKIEG